MNIHRLVCSIVTLLVVTASPVLATCASTVDSASSIEFVELFPTTGVGVPYIVPQANVSYLPSTGTMDIATVPSLAETSRDPFDAQSSSANVGGTLYVVNTSSIESTVPSTGGTQWSTGVSVVPEPAIAALLLPLLFALRLRRRS